MTVEDRIRVGGGGDGIERVEIVLSRQAYSPHRHDTYALGITLAGVQSFRYRGAGHASVPGRVFVLHPDELHDGRAGTETALGYRALYVAPHLIGSALGGAPLPFVEDPVSSAPGLSAAMRTAFADFAAPVGAFAAVDLVAAVADALETAGNAQRRPRPRIDRHSMQRLADALREEPAGAHPDVAAMERATGHDRWTLFRQFRAAHGVSPYRFWTLRRLDRARRMIASGHGLAEAAAASGFTDQSHMSRQFRETYGLPPGRWRRMLAAE
jgi:AraC-like DNA-binding protein